MKELDTGHFLFMVAKDIVVRTHGAKTKDWPETNFYTYISTIMLTIKAEHITKLMKQYKVIKLFRYGSYFEILPPESKDEEIMPNT